MATVNPTHESVALFITLRTVLDESRWAPIEEPAVTEE